MGLCIDLMDNLNVDYTSDNTFTADTELIKNLCAQREWASVDPETIGSVLHHMWTHNFIQSIRRDQNIPDNLFYFMSNIRRIFSPDFIPSHDDILHTRAATTGIVELDFAYQHINFRLVDVGGQSSQRKKWIHCFDSVLAILFLVAMSDYDLALAENSFVNRMHDSLELFHSISNAVYFQKTSTVLFLNKSDVFEKKIISSSLAHCFKDYKGPSTFTEAATYVRDQFLKLKPPEKTVYSYFTNATNTDNISLVFAATVDITMTRNIAKTNMN